MIPSQPLAVPRPEPPRYPAVLIDRLFAAAQKAWRRVWNPKLAGERIEMLFMYEAARRGLIVSKPFGDSAPYDAIVDDPKPPGKLWRVQVRSVSVERGGAYAIRTTYGQLASRRLTKRDIDVLAAYVVPHEAWYLIPVEAFGCKLGVWLRPHNRPKGKLALYEHFREAWSLIGADAKPATGPGSHK